MNAPRRLVSLALLLTAVGPAGADEARLRQENAALRETVAELQAQVEALQSRLALLRAEKVQLNTEKTQLETQKQELAREKQELVREKRSIEQRAQEFFLVRAQDPDTGRTTLRSKLMPMTVLVGPPRFHWISFNYGFEGSQPPQPPGPVELEFQSFFTGIKYKKADKISFHADGRTIDCPVTDYRYKYRTTLSSRKRVRKDDEYLTARLTAEDLRALAEAGNVTGTIGHTRFELSDEQTNTFKALAYELGLAGR